MPCWPRLRAPPTRTSPVGLSDVPSCTSPLDSHRRFPSCVLFAALQPSVLAMRSQSRTRSNSRFVRCSPSGRPLSRRSPRPRASLVSPPCPPQGISHLALVCSDMERTVRFYCDLLGLALVKTIELPDGAASRPSRWARWPRPDRVPCRQPWRLCWRRPGGQHFFFDIGQGNLLAYFWFPNAPKAAPGVASVDPEGLARGTCRRVPCRPVVRLARLMHSPLFRSWEGWTPQALSRPRTAA